MNHDLPRPRARGLGSNFGFLTAPPPVARIVARAQVCCALLLRGELESAPDRREAAELVATVLDWLERCGAAAELEAPERAALEAPCGTLGPEARERCGWLGEAAAVLAWAIRRAPLPPPGAQADGAAIAQSLEFLSPEAASLHSRAPLRARGELLAALELLELAGSRLHQAIAGGAEGEPPGPSLARLRAADFPWPEELVPFSFAGDELALGQRALDRCGQGELFAAWRAVGERRRAALWLLGAERQFSAVTLGSG